MTNSYFEELARRNPTKMGRDRDTDLPFILSEAQRKQTQQILIWYQIDRERGYGETGVGPMTRDEKDELIDLIECFEGAS